MDWTGWLLVAAALLVVATVAVVALALVELARGNTKTTHPGKTDDG